VAGALAVKKRRVFVQKVQKGTTTQGEGDLRHNRETKRAGFNGSGEKRR